MPMYGEGGKSSLLLDDMLNQEDGRGRNKPNLLLSVNSTTPRAPCALSAVLGSHCSFSCFYVNLDRIREIAKGRITKMVKRKIHCHGRTIYFGSNLKSNNFEAAITSTTHGAPLRPPAFIMRSGSAEWTVSHDHLSVGG